MALFILTLAMPCFIKIVNKYMDTIEKYRKEQLEKDFNKIKAKQNMEVIKDEIL